MRALLALIAAAILQLDLRAEELSAQSVRFNADIRPILSQHCIACHGPDEADRQADLRLDTFDGATADLGDYAAIAPGQPKQSALIERVETNDEDLRMPPADHADRLSAEQVALLKQWIRAGGTYESHWSFVVPQQSPPPATPSNARVHNEIDAFVLQRMNSAGLSQNPRENPRALVRRVSLDLTGLPPLAHPKSCQSAIAAYLSEPTLEHYGDLVDELLATAAYAEHWTSMWLDIARYADTVGYSGDEYRDIWPWRDWLIRAIAANKSYEQFTTEMLAGDLLPNASVDQQLATAFHRNTLNNNEGGTNDEEFRTIAVKDRISTTVNAWMGLTIRCAECHSHKYDPLTQREYYEFLDFFNQTADADKNDDRPRVEVYPPGREKQFAGLNEQIDTLLQKREQQPSPWKIRRPVQTASRDGTTFEVLDDDAVLATGPNPAYEEYAFTFQLPAGETIQSLRIEVLPHKRNGGNVGRIADGAFIISQFRLVRIVDGQEQLLEFSDAAADYSQVNRHITSTIKQKIDAKHFKQGWAVNHQQDGYRAHREAVLSLREPLKCDADTSIKLFILHEAEWPGLNVGCVRVATCNATQGAEQYRQKKLDPLGREINALRAQINGPVRVPVLQELPEKSRRQTHVMARGNFQSRLEKVAAQFPSGFHAMPGDTPRNRLGVARWLFSTDNPLTSRVAVNRYWARLFGIGIVETEEDFGTQGSPPTHPALLDWLAVDFREQGWDVKRLLKQIVSSATYQQSPALSPQALELDPRNLLLSHGPRVRLTAEVVRDQSLAVAGLLTQKLYGPPVYPPSPIKRIVNAFTGGMTWVDSEGEDRYRRTLYTYIKRSSPHPLLETFDVATRETCSMRRLRTNTPLQSFMTLNDVMFVEAAQALAERMSQAATATSSLTDTNAGSQVHSQIAYGLAQALFEQPERKQVDVLYELYETAHAQYSRDYAGAAKIAGFKEFDAKEYESDASAAHRLVHRAALTVVANVILNLDSFLNN
ncbi:MAG: PSD1 and planctomycete cytochrome C domain-containing protein [Bythopirellula sp.]